MDIPDLAPLYRTFPDAPLVSISDAQRAALPTANWLGTIYHGLPPDLFTFQPGPGKYLAFLGRLSREKRPDRAVDIARALGMPLKIAAKLDQRDAAYYERHVRPLLEDPLVEYVGEIGEQDKGRFLGDAAALLFPIEWPEPFGLVMIEALACGTPVVAFNKGSVPEIMTDGVSGFVVDDVPAAVRATRRALALPRAGCRAYFERRFLTARMAEDYMDLYRRLVTAEGAEAEAAQPAAALDGAAAADGRHAALDLA
jgi:glycosyltransferase involved in cell wall biosynthesis